MDIKKATILLFLILHSLPLLSQVADIKEKVKADQKSNPSKKPYYSEPTTNTSFSDNNEEAHSSYNSDCNCLDDIPTCIVSAIFKGIGHLTFAAQKSTLKKRNEIPDIVSLSTGLDFQSNFYSQTFNPKIRGNWGLFSTDFQYTSLHDHSGSLNSVDWQVLILSIPIKILKVNYGIGFTSLLEPKTTYFESSVGIKLSLNKYKLNLNTNYRWTTQKLNSNRYRQVFNFTADYQIWSNGNIHLSPLVGVNYQEYFSKHTYLLYTLGVRFRVY
jgi:hypothetical protein